MVTRVVVTDVEGYGWYEWKMKERTLYGCKEVQSVSPHRNNKTRHLRDLGRMNISLNFIYLPWVSDCFYQL